MRSEQILFDLDGLLPISSMRILILYMHVLDKYMQVLVAMLQALDIAQIGVDDL